MTKTDAAELHLRERNALERPTDLDRKGVSEISSSLCRLLADVFALYVKTKNFHWHMSGQHFRDYHLLLDEHSDQIVAMTGDIAERARKVGGTTIRSIRDIADHQRLKDNDEELVTPGDMLAELCTDYTHRHSRHCGSRSFLLSSTEGEAPRPAFESAGNSRETPYTFLTLARRHCK